MMVREGMEVNDRERAAESEEEIETDPATKRPKVTLNYGLQFYRLIVLLIKEISFLHSRLREQTGLDPVIL